MEGANFLSGKSIRANCGLNEPAMSDRSRDVLVLFLLRDVEFEAVGMNDNSCREARYWVRLDEISERV